MPVNYELSIIIRHLEWLEALLRNHGGMQVSTPMVPRPRPGRPQEGQLTYTDPNGEVIDVTIVLNSVHHG